MDAQYVSSMYTIDTEDTFACTKWMTDKGAEGVSGYIAYAILLFFLSYFIFPTNNIYSTFSSFCIFEFTSSS